MEIIMLTEMHLWLLGTAVLFTFVGIWFARENVTTLSGKIIEATIDRLIADGYVKIKRVNGEIELLKYNEE
jgi:hypothetical protein